MVHIFLKANPEHPTFILLHGTGGNENDLIPLAKTIDPRANIIGIRGNVIEDGNITRYFKRIAHGIFDQDSLTQETNNLYYYLDTLATKYNLDRKKFVMMGYSNGATMTASILQRFKTPLLGAILLHPFIPTVEKKPSDLSMVKILVTTANNDLICPPDHSEFLKKQFQDAKAETDIYYGNRKHSISEDELAYIKAWYENKIKK
jgi:phospholipase/carboxylesterase